MPRLIEFSDKAPDEARRFQLGWSDLLPSGRTCASIAVTSDLPGLTFSDDSVSNTETSVKIAGGTEGEDHNLVWTMTDNAGDIYIQVVLLRIRLKT